MTSPTPIPITPQNPFGQINCDLLYCRWIMDEINKVFAKLDTATESGTLAETMLRLLPQDIFNRIMQFGEYARVHKGEITKQQIMIAAAISYAVASKLRKEISEAEYIRSLTALVTLIYYEDMRRKDLIEYAWYNDLYGDAPSYPGFTRLTEQGKQIALEDTPVISKYKN